MFALTGKVRLNGVIIQLQKKIIGIHLFLSFFSTEKLRVLICAARKTFRTC